MTLAQMRDRILHSLCEIFLFIAVFALLAVMAIIVVDVAMRYILNAPIRGSYDLVTLCLTAMVAFGLPRVVFDNAEIVIDIVDAVFPRWLIGVLTTLGTFFTAGIFAFLLWAMFGETQNAFRYGDRLLQLNLPTWWIWVLVLIGFSVSVLTALGVLWRRFDSSDARLHRGDSGALL